MNKAKRLFNSLIFSFIMIGVLCLGIFMPNSFNKNDLNAQAAISDYDVISNSLPDYFEIITSQGTNATVGQVDNTIYLFQENSYKQVIIGNDELTTSNPSEIGKDTNYAYLVNDADTTHQEFYYFDFQESLSLYYNLTNEQIQQGQTGTNLLQNSDIGSFTKSHEKGFVPSNESFTPQQFKIQFELDTSLSSVSPEANGLVKLNQEGCYTLVVPLLAYYTDNGGITFTSEPKRVYYTFMVFNANTYFNSTTGLPNLTISSNMQQTTLATSNNFSKYYYFNSGYGQSANTLANIKYNPNIYQLTIAYTDVDQNTYSTTLEYLNGRIRQYDENENEYNEDEYFIETSLLSENEVQLVFYNLGSYDISFNYLYIAKTGNEEIIYNLPLENMDSSTVFNNKNQRVYIYGYQAVYSDYANIDPLTNQPESVELKTFDFDNATYNDSADITSSFNNYIINSSSSDDNDISQLQNILRNPTPTSNSVFNITTLRENVVKFINEKQITPVSTNQTPIKFLNNTNLNAVYSKIYNVETIENDGNKTISITNINDSNNSFQGFNQNEAGTYIYIIQYQFDSYMSQSGTLQSAFYNYQIFYFTVTNTIPTVTVLDTDFNEIYSNGFTNKGVYILNDAENNIYDAKVEITLSAYDYVAERPIFENTSIDALSRYGITYRQFEPSSEDTDTAYNENVAGKYGIFIENTNSIANAKFTIYIRSINSDKPSTSSFTIDTYGISPVTSRNVSLSTSTTYRIGSSFSSNSTNQPMIFSWDEKDSGATTYGFVKYIPTQAINYYSALQNEDDLYNLLTLLVTFNDTLPVSYKIDLANATDWSEYQNTKSYTSTINTSYVKSNDGFYILEVYDQAGNSTFGIYLLDSSAPIFLQSIYANGITTRNLISNNESISVPDENTSISIEWTSNKAIYIDNHDLITSGSSLYQAYQYGKNVESAQEKLDALLNDYFVNNSSIENITNLGSVPTNDGSNGAIATGISSYNGNYFIIPIDETAYLKDTLHSTYENYTGFSYEIDFIDDDGQALEGTYRILIKDASNTQVAPGEDFRNYPSSYLIFNVTSDASKISIGSSDGSIYEVAYFNLTGYLYSYEDESGNTIYSHLEPTDVEEPVLTSLPYKFSYYTPLSATEDIIISYVPFAENGSIVQSIKLYYYRYEAKSTEIGNATYFYYDIEDSPYRIIDVYTYSPDVVYDSDYELTYTLQLNSSTFGAGRYVIERTYIDGNATDQYDYFKRTITFNVDNYNLISELESIQKEDGSSSLESIVGGDIILSMYSGNNNSSIVVSFPYINGDGLNSGSFYTKDSFASVDETLETFNVSGNKLPMTLYVPKYKYTVSTSSSTNNDTNAKEYSVDHNDNLSYYGGGTVVFNEETRYYDVIIEGLTVESFSTEIAAYNYLNNNASIAEYEVYVEVEARTNAGRTYYYRSNGSTTNGFLNLYQVSTQGGTISATTQPTTYFYEPGQYIVTMYQANNLGATSDFYKFYKFGWNITSQEPDFEIIGSDGYTLTSTNNNSTNVYYTNSDSLTIQWEVPTSQYEARIDEDNIYITSYPQSFTRSEISGEGTRYFTIDTSNLIIADNSYIEITMQYYGYNSAYYNQITKRIYFDRSAPTQNLQNLMTNTETATKSAFTKSYQELYMRKYYDYKNEEQEVNSNSNLNIYSYSYSLDTGNLRYYSYNVTKDYFTTTLKETLDNSSRYPYDTQNVYYRYIDNLNNGYTQVDKNSFTSGNYNNLYERIYETENFEVQCGYYEIVELDYAKNMSVYIVYVIDSSNENDQNVNTNALSYINSQNEEDIIIDNGQITSGFNIYSNSGFELTSFRYQSDPWAMFYVQISGQGEVRYMKSPWLNENELYRVIFNSTGVVFEQTTLDSIFESVSSSSNKHNMTLTDRYNGTNTIIYLSIMDASIRTDKVEDPLKQSAILNITVPTNSEVESTTTSYIFPTDIKIYQFDDSIVDTDKWVLIMDAYQSPYGTWVPTEDFTPMPSYITFNTLANGTTLQISINLGANASQKIKWEITDNFGGTQTIIQLANEVAYDEISGDSTIYEISESDGSTTYISDQTIRFSYNTLLYSVQIYNSNDEEITRTIERNDGANNISYYNLSPTDANIYNDYYRIEIFDVETGTLTDIYHIVIYYQLPFVTTTMNDIPNGAIIFNDKNQNPITELGTLPSYTVNFYGTPYTASARTITTYSQNISVYFKDGQSLDYEGEFNYEKGYSYSVYLSRDNGSTWENMNSDNSATSGYTISGVGDYLILIKYDSDTIFTNLCAIYQISILDSASSYYYITVDGINVERSDISYVSTSGIQYPTTYIVSVRYDDKGNRLSIIPNEELGVNVNLIAEDPTGTDIRVEIYNYVCDESRGDFVIIYIEETDDIVSQFNYENASGNIESIESETSALITAQNADFDRLKISFSRYYGIEQNVVHIEVLKLFNGQYINIYPEIYQENDASYIYLEKAGSYRLRLYDSCTPANVQLFGSSEYFDLIFLNYTPLLVTSTDSEGNTIITEPIQNAVYNSSVTLSLVKLSTYYHPTGYPTISVKRNGVEYSARTNADSTTGYIARNNEYTFEEAGYYVVTFTATSTTGIPIRTVEFKFSIINKNESRYAFEFTTYGNYYIKSVIKDTRDITEDLIEISNLDTVVINNKVYLSELLLSYLDEKTGGGRYTITICPNDSVYLNTIGEEFTFEIWINVATPPITVSIPEGTSTTSNITITLNVQNYYDAIGDSYIRIGSSIYNYNSDTIASMGETSTITITSSGVHYIQIYTASGHLLYSYKVEKTDPLNGFAIMAIVFGVIAVAAIIGITLALRKRQRVK